MTDNGNKYLLFSCIIVNKAYITNKYNKLIYLKFEELRVYRDNLFPFSCKERRDNKEANNEGKNNKEKRGNKNAKKRRV